MELDCVAGIGANYRGNTNVSDSGKNCLRWDEPDIMDFVSKKATNNNGGIMTTIVANDVDIN